MPHNNAKLNTTILVYVATFNDDVVVTGVEPAIRNEMIQRCTDKLTKQQRFCVWKLLDKALRDCYDASTSVFNFYVDDTGKWQCRNGVHFSLAHSNNVVAVALCNHYVGMDIESVARFERKACDMGFARRILTDNELAQLHNTPIDTRAEVLATTWTKKESLYKFCSRGAFSPKTIDTTQRPIYSQVVTIDGAKYALSVARCIPSKIELVQLGDGAGIY